MKKIAITHLGTPYECFVSTSVLKGLKRVFKHFEVHVIVAGKASEAIFKYNRKIRNCHISSHAEKELQNENFDLLINLHPGFSEGTHFEIKASEKRGFGFTEGWEKQYDILYGDKRTKRNVFQVYSDLAEITWRGESYDFHYHPKTHCKAKRVGLAVAHAGIRNYIQDRLRFDEAQLWNVPFKKNLFKKIDELNRCQDIVTDDFFVMHLAIFLRKNVYFLQTIQPKTKYEFFRTKHQVIKIPEPIIIMS